MPYSQESIDEAVITIKRANATRDISDAVEVIEAQESGLGWYALSLIDDADLSDTRPVQAGRTTGQERAIVNNLSKLHAAYLAYRSAPRSTLRLRLTEEQIARRDALYADLTAAIADIPDEVLVPGPLDGVYDTEDGDETLSPEQHLISERARCRADAAQRPAVWAHSLLHDAGLVEA
jgi:hypothetical protein